MPLDKETYIPYLDGKKDFRIEWTTDPSFCRHYLKYDTRIYLLAIANKNMDRAIFCYSLKNSRMCKMMIEALTPLNRTSNIKMHKKYRLVQMLF